LHARHKHITCSRGISDVRPLKLSRTFTLIEPGPVILVTTYDGIKSNVMTISWTMVLDFTPVFAITTGLPPPHHFLH
jgi:flavin reductase (DIM6/NTAB) family NADH-FMN oxidoreductase RutF